MRLLLNEEILPQEYKDHPLKGAWKPHRDLHIAPAWILLYKINGNDCIFSRIGTHADIFYK